MAQLWSPPDDTWTKLPEVGASDIWPQSPTLVVPQHWMEPEGSMPQPCKSPTEICEIFSIAGNKALEILQHWMEPLLSMAQLINTPDEIWVGVAEGRDSLDGGAFSAARNCAWSGSWRGRVGLFFGFIFVFSAGFRVGWGKWGLGRCSNVSYA